MKIKLALLATCCIFIYACGGTVRNPTKPDIASDTLVYTYKTLKQRADDCGTKPDSACTVIKITYPEFKGAPVLNDTLKRDVINFFAINKQPDTAFSTLSAAFIKQYKYDMTTVDREGMFYTINTNATVIRQDSALTTLQINGYQFMGGAHGASSIHFINWDTKTNKKFKLDDILVTGYLPKLNAIAEKIFRKNELLSDNASLAADYFFKDAKFNVNNNFLISPLGIRFLYNQYEIKPYAAGQTDLLVPYAKLKGLLKPSTVVAQYLH